MSAVEEVREKEVIGSKQSKGYGRAARARPGDFSTYRNADSGVAVEFGSKADGGRRGQGGLRKWTDIVVCWYWRANQAGCVDAVSRVFIPNKGGGASEAGWEGRTKVAIEIGWRVKFSKGGEKRVWESLKVCSLHVRGTVLVLWMQELRGAGGGREALVFKGERAG